MRPGFLGALIVMTSIASAAPPKTRAEFAKAAATIKAGMDTAKVTAILGPPEDVRTEAEPGGISAARTVAIWRWGTHGHGTFASWGAVHVMANNTVQYVFGDRPPSAAIAGIAEPDLRRYLDALAAVPSYNGRGDAIALIRAVNTLLPLGKERALAVIEEFLRVSSGLDDDGRDGVFLVNRTLFETAGAAPAMMVGAPSPDVANPIVIVGDLPLKVVTGYALAGSPERPEDDVAAYRTLGKAAKLRAKPLAPSVTSLDAIDPKLRAIVADQALRAFGTVYRPSDRTVDSWFPVDTDARWAAIRADIAAIAKAGASWNASTMQFELAKGGTLPALVTQFPRVWWDAKVTNAAKARLTLQRLDDALVTVEWRIEAAGAVAGGTIEIVDAASKKSRGKLPFSPIAQGGRAMTMRLAIPRGTSVTVQLAGATSPPLTP